MAVCGSKVTCPTIGWIARETRSQLKSPTALRRVAQLNLDMLLRSRYVIRPSGQDDLYASSSARLDGTCRYSRFGPEAKLMRS
jgi:hypothetical protein